MVIVGAQISCGWNEEKNQNVTEKGLSSLQQTLFIAGRLAQYPYNYLAA